MSVTADPGARDVFHAGDRVRLRPDSGDGQWIVAVLVVTSENRKSVAVSLGDAAIRTPDGGLITGVLPLTIDYEAETVTDLFGNYYEMEYAAPIERQQ